MGLIGKSADRLSLTWTDSDFFILARALFEPTVIFFLPVTKNVSDLFFFVLKTSKRNKTKQNEISDIGGVEQILMSQEQQRPFSFDLIEQMTDFMLTTKKFMPRLAR